MIKTYLTNITPDSLSGLTFGFEGVKNTVLLMNGPTGCKFYHSATSDNQALRQEEFDPLNYPELYYFGQPRIPCTYLDKRDYVYGSRDKLTEAMNFLKNNLDFDLFVVLNSPGAALIGDDLESIVSDVITEVPVITVETPGYSEYIWAGFEKACISLIDTLALPEPEPFEKKTVNILGLSIFHKYYQGDINELRHDLDLCNINVNTFLGSDCSVSEIKNMGAAHLNIVIRSEYGIRTAEHLKEKFGTDYIVCDSIPAGYKAMEELMHKVSEKLNTTDQYFITESEKARARSYIYLSRTNSLTGLPKGVKFAVHGTASQCLGYCRFLVSYLGMYADSVSVLGDDADSAGLKDFLKLYNMEDSLSKPVLETDADIVFADGNIIAKLKARHHCFSGIEISLPSLGYIDVVPKTHLGINGGLLLTEEVLNSLPY